MNWLLKIYITVQKEKSPYFMLQMLMDICLIDSALLRYRKKYILKLHLKMCIYSRKTTYDQT